MAKTATSSPFELIVREAVEIELELRHLQAPAHRKLTGPAFLREALRNGNTTRDRVAKLRAAIESNPLGFPRTLKFLRRAGQAIRNSTMPSPPPNASHPYFGPQSLDGDSAQAELTTVGSHILEALVLAVEDVMRGFPEAFGTADDLAAYTKHFEDLQVRRQRLFKRIGEEFTVGDLVFGSYTEPPTFRIATGIVSIAPQHDAGERLTNWIATQPTVLQALGVKVP
jgi:hypothetical protein